MSTANKEVRVTFRAIDKTRASFNKLRYNCEQLQNQLSKVRMNFSRIGVAMAGAFGAAALKRIIDNGAAIGKLSNKLDVSTKALSELRYVASKCDVDFSTLSSGLEELAKRTKQAAKGSGEAKEALRLLGLSARELSNLSPDQQFSQIAEKLSHVADSSERAKFAVKLFGESGASLLPILEQGADGIGKLQKEANSLGASLSGENCASMTKFNEELLKLQTIMNSLLVSVLIPILPTITGFFAAIREGHPALTFIIRAISTLLAFKLAAWFITATTAARAFTVALMANPFAMVAVAISTVVAALVSLKQWLRSSKKATDEYNESLSKTIQLADISLPSQEKENKVAAKRNELQMEAKRIFEQTRTPLEKHNTEIEKLNKLLKAGLIDQDTYNRAMEQNRAQLDKTEEESENLFAMIENRSAEASKSLIDNFAEGVFSVGGKMKDLKSICGDFFNQLQVDILKMTLKQALLGEGGSGSILGRLGSFFGSGGSSSGMFAGFFAEGGSARAGKAHIVGDGGEPELFIPNSSGTIVPFSELKNRGNNSPNITVNMNIQTPDLVSFNYSRSQIATDMARQIARASRNL